LKKKDKGGKTCVRVDEARKIFKGDVRGGAIFRLYERLFEGDEINFNMCSGGAVNFRVGADGRQTTLNTFNRRVRFVEVSGVWEEQVIEAGSIMIDDE
jgi:hypothetical protein